MGTTSTKRLAEPFGADRQLAEVLRELNELRRSRSLPQHHETTTTVAVELGRTASERGRMPARLG